jgi:hypothetical protein
MEPKTRFIFEYLMLAIFVLLMILTRAQHVSTPFALPDASLAVFFFAARYLKSASYFIVLFVFSVIIDYFAITSFGVSDYCITPAYIFMLPTYGVMWWAGRALSKSAQTAWPNWGLGLLIALSLSTSLAFLISNGSFFWFSGKVLNTEFSQYSLEMTGYYLPYLVSTLFYGLLVFVLEGLLLTIINARHDGIKFR